MNTSTKGWVCSFFASFFFLFQYMQMNVFNALSKFIMAGLSLTPLQLSQLSSIYLLGVVIFFIPAGLLLDRFSTRKLMLIGLSISIIACFLFALGHTYYVEYIFRLLSGCVHGIAFLSAYRIAAQWIEKRRGLAMGMITSVALTGGIIVQAPVVYICENYNWHIAMLCIAVFGVFAWLMIYLFVHENPASAFKHSKQQNRVTLLEVFKRIITVLTNKQNILCPLYTSALNMPLMILAALWGNIYLTQTQGFSYIQSSFIMSALYVGTIIGSPTAGFISDKLGSRKRPMNYGALLTLTLLVILFLLKLNYIEYIIFFVGIGLTTSTQSLTYPTVTESNDKHVVSTAMGLANAIIMGGAGVYQLLFGYFFHKDIQLNLFGHVYGEYKSAFLMIPCAVFIAFLLSLLIRDTRCQARH